MAGKSVEINLMNAALDITLHVECYRWRAGECRAIQLDSQTMFLNPTRKYARYAMVIACETPSRR
jgi:hypothetical protein